MSGAQQQLTAFSAVEPQMPPKLAMRSPTPIGSTEPQQVQCRAPILQQPQCSMMAPPPQQMQHQGLFPHPMMMCPGMVQNVMQSQLPQMSGGLAANMMWGPAHAANFRWPPASPVSMPPVGVGGMRVASNASWAHASAANSAWAPGTASNMAWAPGMSSNPVQASGMVMAANSAQQPDQPARPVSGLELSRMTKSRKLPRSCLFAGGPSSNRSISLKHRRQAVSLMERAILPTLTYNSSAYMIDMLMCIGTGLMPYMRLTNLGISSLEQYFTCS